GEVARRAGEGSTRVALRTLSRRFAPTSPRGRGGSRLHWSHLNFPLTLLPSTNRFRRDEVATHPMSGRDLQQLRLNLGALFNPFAAPRHELATDRQIQNAGNVPGD